MIAIKCLNEDVVIGHLEASSGDKIKMTPDNVWNKFIPIDNDWKLPVARQKAGTYLKCPRCSGYLGIEAEPKAKKKRARKGEERPREKLSREEIRRNIQREAAKENATGHPTEVYHGTNILKDKHTPIILGVTVVTAS